MSLKAVIMAGGKGTRLRPITYSIPKPLVPIAGKPCIGYVLDSYYEAGIKDAIITAGYKFEALINGVIKFKHPDQNILFSVEREPVGTAGSIKLVSKFLDDTFIVGSGDTLADFNITNILKFHREKKSKLTIALTTVDDPSQFGIVEMEDNVVTKFLEKPTPDKAFSNLINAGLYIIEPEILDLIPEGKPYDFAKELFPKLLENGIRIHGYVGEGTWLDTGRPNDMIRANQLMTEKYGYTFSDPEVSGKLIVNSSLRHFKGSRLTGPTFIGEGVNSMEGTIIEGSAVYDGVQIGKNVTITDSILMDGVKVLDGAKIERSVIMKGTVIGQKCEIHESVLAPKLNLQSNSRVYNVSLSSEIVEEEN